MNLLIHYFSLLVVFPGDLFGIKEYGNWNTELTNYLGTKIEAHKLTFDPGNIHDYIDAFLCEVQLRQNEGDKEISNNHYFTGCLNF